MHSKQPIPSQTPKGTLLNLEIFNKNRCHLFQAEVTGPTIVKLTSKSEYINLHACLWDWMKDNNLLTKEFMKQKIQEYRQYIIHNKTYIDIGREALIHNTNEFLSDIETKLKNLKTKNLEALSKQNTQKSDI